MNKWFASARDISDSESSDSSDEEQKKPTQQQAQPQAKKTHGAQASQRRTNYMRNFEGSSESEEEQRVVKTDKDKKMEIFNELKKEIYNHIKINDFNSLMTDFEKLSDEVEKD